MYKNSILNKYNKWYGKYREKYDKYQTKLRQEVIDILQKHFGGRIEMSEWLDDDNYDNGASLSLTDKHGWSENPLINHIGLFKTKDDDDIHVSFQVSSEANWGDLDERYIYDIDWSAILATLCIILEDIEKNEFNFSKQTHYLKKLYEED